MTKPDQTFDDPAEFRQAIAGKPSKAPRKRAQPRDARPDIPRAPSGEGDRTEALRRLSALGFMPRWRCGAGHDFWHLDGRSTSAHATYAEAVKAAEKELKQ